MRSDDDIRAEVEKLERQRAEAAAQTTKEDAERAVTGRLASARGQAAAHAGLDSLAGQPSPEQSMWMGAYVALSQPSAKALVLDHVDRDLPPAKEKDARLAKIGKRIDELTKDLKRRELKRERDELERRLREVDAATNATTNATR